VPASQCLRPITIEVRCRRFCSKTFFYEAFPLEKLCQLKPFVCTRASDPKGASLRAITQFMQRPQMRLPPTLIGGADLSVDQLGEHRGSGVNAATFGPGKLVAG